MFRDLFLARAYSVKPSLDDAAYDGQRHEQ